MGPPVRSASQGSYQHVWTDSAFGFEFLQAVSKHKLHHDGDYTNNQESAEPYQSQGDSIHGQGLPIYKQPGVNYMNDRLDFCYTPPVISETFNDSERHESTSRLCSWVTRDTCTLQGRGFTYRLAVSHGTAQHNAAAHQAVRSAEDGVSLHELS